MAKTKTIERKTDIKTARIRPLLSIAADDSGTLPSKIEVLQTGMWDTPYHGLFMITPDDLQQYIQNFNADVRPSSSTKGLPIDLDHDAGAAAGWMTGLTAQPNDLGGWSLWADVDWTDLGQQKLLGGQYAFFSPEFCPEGYYDPEGVDEPLDNVLIGGGLTNRPLFKDLEPVMASDATGKATGLKSQFNKMFISAKEDVVPTLDEVRVKDAADLTAEEKQLLAEKQGELSQDERDKFSTVLTGDNNNGNEPAADGGEGGEGNEPAAGAGDEGGEGAEPQNQNQPNTQEGEPVAAKDKSGKTVTISASEWEAAQEKIAQGVSASEKLIRKEAEDHVNSKVYASETGFKMPADLKDELVTLYVSANDKQKATLDKLFDAAQPIKKADEMGAQGSGAEFDKGSAYSALKDKAEAIVTASDGKTSFADAMLEARQANPELAAAYDDEYQAGKPKVASR